MSAEKEQLKSHIVDVGSLPADPPAIAKTNGNVLDLFSLKGKVCAVSGSSQGIGFAVAEAYAQAGGDVILMYNSTPCDAKVEYLTKTYGIKCKAYQCPIDQMEKVTKTVNQIVEDFGRIDVFVANAGVAWNSGSILDNSDEKAYTDWKKIFDCDVDGVFFCAKAVGEVFKRQKAQGMGKGSFVITASISAHIVNFPQFQTPYNAAKAAVLHLSKSLAIEFVDFARVNSVSPGYIATEMVFSLPPHLMNAWHAHTPQGRMGMPRELVGAYLYLASDASTYTTGTDIIVDGGYTSI